MVSKTSSLSSQSPEKRRREEDIQERKAVKTDANQDASQLMTKDTPMDPQEELEFEDMWEDEMESEPEDEVVEEGNDDADADMIEDDDQEEEKVQVYLPGQELGEDEELVADPSTYDMLHAMNVEWPCLSFDVIHDSLGSNRTSYPMTSYFVAGSQADTAKNNKLYVMKLSSLYRTKISEDSDDEDDDGDADLDEDPILEYKTIPHNGGVNRIRLMPHTSQQLVASMSDNGKVYIHDISTHVQSLDTPGLIPPKNPAPLYTVTSHGASEGYAVDWSSLKVGNLLTGDVSRRIFLTHGTPGAFVTDETPFTGHNSSVEDLQWSPSQGSVFASCSADKTIRIWDIRDKKSAKLSIVAHDTDVNVISWNRSVDYLLASGSDSGQFSIWDLRTWVSTTSPEPAATFKWHRAPISSLEWNPHESSVIAVCGADDQLTLWDLALERDQEEETISTTIPTTTLGSDGKPVEVPPQLLFIHQGQRNIKEVHWHKQIPGVLMSTAYDSFNIFKTINS